VLPEQVFVLPTKEENMQIRYLSGPRKDTTEHVARTTTIQQLLNAGLIEEIAPPPPAPPKVSWGVHRGRETDRPAIVGRCNREVCGTVRFEGKPEDAHITIFTHSCSATPPEKAPAEILNAYCQAVKENQGTLSPDEGNMLEFAHSRGDSGKHAKLLNGYGLDGKPQYKERWW
jgi:hypothetical protein